MRDNACDDVSCRAAPRSATTCISSPLARSRAAQPTVYRFPNPRSRCRASMGATRKPVRVSVTTRYTFFPNPFSRSRYKSATVNVPQVMFDVYVRTHARTHSHPYTAAPLLLQSRLRSTLFLFLTLHSSFSLLRRRRLSIALGSPISDVFVVFFFFFVVGVAPGVYEVKGMT